MEKSFALTLITMSMISRSTATFGDPLFRNNGVGRLIDNFDKIVKPMKYTLNVKETGNKAGKYHYTVTDETGKIISERKSNRTYVAATIDGQYYFGRIDLIGKGEHSKHVKRCPVDQQTPIAYL